MKVNRRALYLVLIAVIVCGLLAFIFFGCAPQVVTAPSTAPLQSDLGHAQTNITKAKSIVQTVDAKDRMIDEYRKWKIDHP